MPQALWRAKTPHSRLPGWDPRRHDRAWERRTNPGMPGFMIGDGAISPGNPLPLSRFHGTLT